MSGLAVRLLGVTLAVAASAGCRRQRSWDVDGDGIVRLVILGDSNSSDLNPEIWWRKLEARLDEREPGAWNVRSYARLGALIGPYPKGPLLGGPAQVDSALAAVPPADVVVLAFGTNDLMLGRSPEETVTAYASAISRLEGAGMHVLVAYTPPCFSAKCNLAAIAAQNHLLDARLPGAAKVDFASWVTPAELLADGVHFNAAGHEKRRDAALRALVAR